MGAKNSELIAGIEEAITSLESSLPTYLDGKTLSKTSKLPYKLASINYSYSYRFLVIAKTALQLFKNEEYLSSAILIRSSMETSSMLFYLLNKIEDFLNELNCEQIDSFMMKVLVGGKLKSDVYVIDNCLKAIDKVTKKKFDKFREMYDQLSEFAHPNWAGSAGYFSKIESEGIKEFNISKKMESPFFILFPFSVSTALLVDSFENIQKIMPNFIKQCEVSCH